MTITAPDPASTGPSSWGIVCTTVVLAPGEYLELVFQVSYATTPELAARVRVSDTFRVDPVTANNEAMQRFLP